ncbi:hypothetical protein ACFX15_032174 [Malus domestica]
MVIIPIRLEKKGNWAQQQRGFEEPHLEATLANEEIRLKLRLAYYSSEILIELFGSATLCNSTYPHWMAAISSLAGISFAATFNQVNTRSFAGDYLWTLENLKMK